jgi:hypothetical protein
LPSADLKLKLEKGKIKSRVREINVYSPFKSFKPFNRFAQFKSLGASDA